MSALEKYIVSLTKEEEEQFSGLIEECRCREKKIAGNMEEAYGALESMLKTYALLEKSLDKLSKDCKSANSKLWNLYFALL